MSESEERTGEKLSGAMNSQPQHSLELHQFRNCRCGCIPKGIPSLFEMAEERKAFLRKKLEESTAAAGKDSESIK
jgi:hypothetical protein